MVGVSIRLVDRVCICGHDTRADQDVWRELQLACAVFLVSRISIMLHIVSIDFR
jgi:hypothetical protein